jgi:hypothetical protein
VRVPEGFFPFGKNIAGIRATLRYSIRHLPHLLLPRGLTVKMQYASYASRFNRKRFLYIIRNTAKLYSPG